jgi:serine/threonine-protein kinase
MRIFVSATSSDLGPYRDIVVNELEILSQSVVAKSTLSVDYRELVNMLQEELQNCHALICLVGKVYGTSPPGQPSERPRSYTQIEYDLGQKMGMPTFVFFPGPDCEVYGTGNDTPKEAGLQQAHYDTLRATGRKYEEFSNKDDLRRLIAEAVNTLQNKPPPSGIERTVRTSFPTPLAHLFEAAFKDRQFNSLRRFVLETIRFITLLAMRDAAASGLFDVESADTNRALATLTSEAELQDWRAILHVSCASPPSTSQTRFIPEFATWYTLHSHTLEHLLEAKCRLGDDYLSGQDYQKIQQELERSAIAIYSGLEFLNRYVLVSITSQDGEPTQEFAAEVLCGLQPKRLLLHTTLSSPVQPGLYLLSLNRRESLLLRPAFWYTRQDVCGLWCMHMNGDYRLDLRNFTGGEIHTALDTERSMFTHVPSTPHRVLLLLSSVGEKSSRVCLLDDKSWDRLEHAVLPQGKREQKVDGRFLLHTTPLHRGLHADVFQAFLESSAPTSPPSPDHPVIHLLRTEASDDQTLAAWFNRRRECWTRLQLPCVARLYEIADPSRYSRRPYLITDLVPGRRTLESLIQGGSQLPHALILKVLKTALSVCAEAHRQGIYLVTLPDRHFLIDTDDSIRLTGFEAAINAVEVAHLPQPPLHDLQRFSRDFNSIAPELREGKARLGPPIDVFAIGMLLASMRGLPRVPMTVLPKDAWVKPWQCFAYHCLAEDPDMRFQTVDHLNMLLKDWGPDRSTSPMTVKVSKASFAMAKYPVTNHEYLQFCYEAHHRLPLHLGTHENSPMARFAAPWLPVTHVSLDDAHAYCRWLSKTTEEKWRVPSEAEWMQAAGIDDSADDLRQHLWDEQELTCADANYGCHYRGPTVVGAFAAGQSPSGCFDMAGNVWEWCQDRITGEPRRVLKGGGYQSHASALAVRANRGVIVALKAKDTGFRVLCEQPS